MTGDRVAKIRERVEHTNANFASRYQSNAEKDRAYLLAENAWLRAQLDAVRELHRPFESTDEDGEPIGITACLHCTDHDDVSGERVHDLWPCATARTALNEGGETNDE